MSPGKSSERLIGHKADQQDQMHFTDFDQVSGNATPPHLTIMLKDRILALSPRESIGVHCNICSTMNPAPKFERKELSKVKCWPFPPPVYLFNFLVFCVCISKGNWFLLFIF